MYADGPCGYADWLLSNWTKKRPPKIAFLHLDSTYGRSFLAGIPYIKSLGIEIGPKLVIPARPITVNTELTKMKKANPDAIIVISTASGVSAVLKDAKKLGIPASRFVGNFGNILNIEAVGHYADGMRAFLQFATIDESQRFPGVKVAIDWIREYGETPKPLTKVAWTQGWLIGMLNCEAIDKALDVVDYENLNGEAIIKHGISKMANFDTGGLTAPITWDPEGGRGGRLGHNGVHIVQIKNGRAVSLSDWVPTAHVYPDVIVTPKGKTIPIR